MHRTSMIVCRSLHLATNMVVLFCTKQTMGRRMRGCTGCRVDRTFATFVAAQFSQEDKIELSIFCSAEWANVLAAANESRYNEPTVLLARAPIHLLNRLARSRFYASGWAIAWRHINHRSRFGFCCNKPVETN